MLVIHLIHLSTIKSLAFLPESIFIDDRGGEGHGKL